jgi:hypothetical protein
MKLTTFFLILLAVSLPVVNYAQISFPTASTDPQWRIETGNFFGTPYFGNFSLGNDIVILGKHYEEIMASFPPNSPPTVEGYVRQEGKKVYIRTFSPGSGRVLSNEKMMYDFSLEVNKKIYCAAFSLENPTDSTLCWATSTDSMVYRGVKRKIWNMQYSEKGFITDPPFAVPTIWIEGIGSTTHPFFPLYCISIGCESSCAITCFHESNVLKYMNPNYSSCNIRITDIKNPLTEQEVKLYPRLANYQLTVDNNGLNNLSIQISNSLGQLFMVKQLEKGVNTIDVSGLAAGIYFATMSDGNKRRTEKFVKN